jgi:hypothetical protein
MVGESSSCFRVLLQGEKAASAREVLIFIILNFKTLVMQIKCGTNYDTYIAEHSKTVIILKLKRSRVRFPALPDFLRSSGSGTGSTQPRDDN